MDHKSQKVLSVSKTVEGKQNDKQLACDDPTLYTIPLGETVLADSSYVGLDR